MSDATLTVKIRANDTASKTLEQFKAQLESVHTTARNLGVGMLAMGGAILAGFGLATKAYAEEEAGIMRLSTAMRNMGLSYDDTKASLEAWIDAEQQKTAFADDEQRESLATLILMTGNLASAQDYLSLAMDISAGTGRDLAGATQLIQYALAGNWGMLERYIPALKDVQSEEAKWYKLRELFTGQAQVYGATLAGQMQLMKNNIEDIKETLGSTVAEALLPMIQGINSLTQQIKNTNPEFLKLVTMIGVGAGAGLTLTGGLLILISQIPAIITGFQAMQGLVVALGFSVKVLAGELALLTAGFAMIGFGIYALQKNAEITKLNTELTKGYELALKGYDAEYVKALEHKEAMGYALNAETKAYIESVKAVKAYYDAIKAQAKAQEEANQKLREALALMKEQSRQQNMYNLGMVYMGYLNPATGETTMTPGQAKELADMVKGELPGYQHGGVVEHTGLAYVHQGETVLPRNANLVIDLILDGEVISRKVVDNIMNKVTTQGGR
jgi:hypothetical protein